MGARLRLEEFGAVEPGSPSGGGAPVAAEAVEDVRLQAYEKGYSAGWEDAVASQADDQHRIREDLAQNLRDLSFTYHEARSHVLAGLEPLLRGIADRVLPEMARATLGAAVVAELRSEANRLAVAPPVIEVAPEDFGAVDAALRTALGQDPALPATLRAEPALSPGQAHFRFADEERALDLGALVAAIGALIGDFLDTPQQNDERQTRHG